MMVKRALQARFGTQDEVTLQPKAAINRLSRVMENL